MDDRYSSPRSSSDSDHNGPQNIESMRLAGPGEEDAPERPAFLRHLAIPLGLLVGAAITAGTTYALVARVQNLIANASVGGDIDTWIKKARETAYDGCYYGCTSCDDPSFAFKACELTARARVDGVVCAGDRMWNWRREDRYPRPCLQAVARILMGEELARVKQSYRNQLAIIILTVLGGVVGGFATYWLWRRLTMTRAERETSKTSKARSAASGHTAWSIRRPSTWKIRRSSDDVKSPVNDRKHDEETARSPPSRPSSRRSSRSSISSTSTTSRPNKSGTRLSTLTTASVAALAVTNPPSAAAFPCTGNSPAWNQFFTSSSGPITGVVHAWLSDCSTRQECSRLCSFSCSGSGKSRTCGNKCYNNCRSVTYVKRTPKRIVDDVLPRVRACGFRPVDALGGRGGATERVAHPGIEKEWWVRISVNGLNVTRGDRTDEGVLCLHRIGEGRR